MNKRQRKKNVKKMIMENYKDAPIIIKKIIYSKKNNEFIVNGYLREKNKMTNI